MRTQDRLAFRTQSPPPMDSFTDFSLNESDPLTPDQFAQVVDLSADALLFIDLNNRIRAWNRGAEKLFGYARAEALGRSFDLLVPEDLRRSGELDKICSATRKHGVLRNYQTRRRTRDGRILQVSLNRTAIRDAHGEAVGFAVFLRDLSQEERLKRESDRARQLARIGELASQIAHEVRNPLAGIHGALQILRRRLQPAPAEVEVFDDVAAEIGRLDQLVTDLMRFGRPAASTLARVEFSDWLRSWHQRLMREMEEREVVFQLDLEGLAWVQLDPILFDQTLRNLLENSIEAANGPVQVQLQLRVADGLAKVRYHDDGPGIAPPIRDRVFDPFFTTKSRGSGLGLPICQRHLESLGGELRLGDSAVGGEFLLSLPLDSGEPASGPE